jgi:hypothetical protein
VECGAFEAKARLAGAQLLEVLNRLGHHVTVQALQSVAQTCVLRQVDCVWAVLPKCTTLCTHHDNAARGLVTDLDVKVHPAHQCA